MESTLAVAKTMFLLYDEMYQRKIDEMKMHKLMYFAQRESLIVHDEVLFEEGFYGWKYGPVLLSIRNEFRKKTPFAEVTDEVSEDAKRLIRSVVDRFGKISSWDLSIMSHGEISWMLSRESLKASDNGNVLLSISAMRLDAIRETDRRKERAALA